MTAKRAEHTVYLESKNLDSNMNEKGTQIINNYCAILNI